jgi:hypothetical protein
VNTGDTDHNFIVGNGAYCARAATSGCRRSDPAQRRHLDCRREESDGPGRGDQRREVYRRRFQQSFVDEARKSSTCEYPINPMFGLYAAVTRQTLTGEPAGGWFPNERISIEDAIRAYTLNTAYANFEEKTKGSIEVGKFADLTVLSQNLLKVEPKAIPNTVVLLTIVDGKIVYQKHVVLM